MYASPVLILVVMDNSLVLLQWDLLVEDIAVLILVVMDNSLVLMEGLSQEIVMKGVLILVVMDNSLVRRCRCIS